MSQIFPMQLLDIKNSISVESYDEKNKLNYYVRKSDQFPNYQRYQIQMLIAQIQYLNENCVKISRSYLFYFSRNKTSKCVTVASSLILLMVYGNLSRISHASLTTTLCEFCFEIFLHKNYYMALKSWTKYVHKLPKCLQIFYSVKSIVCIYALIQYSFTYNK